MYIFGTGNVAEIVADYALQKKIKIKSFIDIEPSKKIILNIPTEKYSENLNKKIPIFVAIGYKELNKIRSQKIDFLKARGWKFANIICSNIHNELLGGNIFVANNVSIQPYSQIYSGNFIWDNCVIGHHSRIEEHNWITSGSVIGGYSTLGKNCFLGINTSISHMISIGDFSFIGASTLISQDIKNNSVVIKKSDKVSPFDSDYFTRSGIFK